MTEILDIVDTAVKIGLGAAIAGFSSYALAKRNHNHELAKDEDKDRKSLAKELSLKMEIAETQINESAYFFHGNDMPASRKAAIYALEEITTASALSNLLGNDDLVVIIDRMTKKVEEMYLELTGQSASEEELNKISEKFTELKKTAYPFVRKSYKGEA